MSLNILVGCNICVIQSVFYIYLHTGCLFLKTAGSCWNQNIFSEQEAKHSVA